MAPDQEISSAYLSGSFVPLPRFSREQQIMNESLQLGMICPPGVIMQTDKENGKLFGCFFFCSESAIESGEEHYHTGSMYFSWVMSSVGYAQTTESSAKGEIRTKLHMFLVYDI